MKKIGIIVTTLAFLVALTQCKKEERPSPATESRAVAITLDIKGNGSMRMDVNTGTGEVVYENGDMIYVASGGKFIGILTHNGTNFNGTITDPTVGEPLHFYFLGNVTPAETLSVGTTTSCSVVISDQTEYLPVVEYAPSNEDYVSGATTFTAMLLNKCALVKFNVTTSSETVTCVTGFNNKVIVDFSENHFTYSQENNGIITLPAGNGEKWAILLPQEAMEAGEEGSAYSVDGEYTGTLGAVPTITDNSLLTAGIEVNVTTASIPVGAISGKFTINDDDNQVYFSQGNLQYIGSVSTPYWKYADNQWDYLGATTGQNSADENVDRDLFGWGTSGYNHGAVCYQPWCTSMNSEDYWIYGCNGCELYEQNGQADWGYNAISNGGNTENSGWRTLTISEWDYVFNTRSTTSGVRWAQATVNGVSGTILLPDNWTPSIYALNNTEGGNYSSNIITAEDWASVLEANGAVFLPAAGLRNGISVNYAGDYGDYWSASVRYGNAVTTGAYNVGFFGTGRIGISPYNSRGLGFSVRLVRDVE